MPYKDRKAVCADLKKIYGAVNLDDAEYAKEEFRENMGMDLQTNPKVSQHLKIMGQKLVRTDCFLWISAGDTEGRKLPQNGKEIHQIQGNFSDWWFDQKNHFYERKRDLKEVDNACSWLGTCVFSACDFLWGQVCSLTADEGSTQALEQGYTPLRFIRFGNIRWR